MASPVSLYESAAFRALMAERWQPAIRVSPPYHDDPIYIEAVVQAMLKMVKIDVKALEKAHKSAK